MGKSGKKWKKVGKVVKSGEKWEKWRKLAKSGENWRKVGKSGHFGFRFLPKSIGTSLTTDYSMSVATSNMKLIGAFLIKLYSAQAFSSYFHKMAASSHFGFSDLLQNR